MENTDTTCPRCGSDALYRYGRSRNGKKRFLCLICNRQFVLAPKVPDMEHRPLCGACHSRMHIYKRDKGSIRFRCSRYPQCRMYEKRALPHPIQEVSKA